MLYFVKVIFESDKLLKVDCLQFLVNVDFRTATFERNFPV